MTREEKQKAINALKKSAPIMAMTQQEFSDYIQTINQVMDWLEQEPCEDAVSRQAVIDMTGLSEWFDSSDSYNEFVIALSELPPVTPQEPRKRRETECIQAIYTEALEEGIRCAMCTNTIKSDTGCDGGCIVDTKMYNKVMTEINSRLLRKLP